MLTLMVKTKCVMIVWRKFFFLLVNWKKKEKKNREKHHLTLILYNIFSRKQWRPFISGWPFRGNYLYFKLVIVSFWQILWLTMVFCYINTIRSVVDIDYLHADQEWFWSLVWHGSWLKDIVCKCSYCIYFYLLVYWYYNGIVSLFFLFVYVVYSILMFS